MPTKKTETAKKIKPVKETPFVPTGDVTSDNRELMFLYLAKKKVKKVEVKYSGSGDSGQIDTIEFDDDAPTGLDEELVPGARRAMYVYHVVNGSIVGQCNTGEADIQLGQLIECVCDGLLEEHHAGWENNEGASGGFTIDVPKKTIKLTHHECYEAYHTTKREV